MKIVLTGRDIVAAVLLIGAFTLRALGVNTLVEYIIIAIAVAYGLTSASPYIFPKKPPKNEHDD